jgi:cell fate (sporulation/competence/biofilm development) regulator YmcA (YheA/YmcA/DUF963 family)
MGIFSNVDKNPKDIKEAENNLRNLQKNAVKMQNKRKKKEVKKGFGSY